MDRSVFSSLWGSSKSFLLRKLIKESQNSSLIICENRNEMEKVVQELNFFLPDMEILSFPEYTHEPFDEVKIESTVLSERVTSLKKLIADNDKKVVVGTFYSILKKVFTKNDFKNSIYSLKVGDIISFDELKYILGYLGFVEVEYVTDKGEFLQRGDFFEIFLIDEEYPVRCEFFDDELEAIYYFDPVTIKKVKDVDAIDILPANEILCDEEDLIKNIKDDTVRERIKEFGKFAGVHWYAPYVQKLTPFWEYMGKIDKVYFLGDGFQNKIENYFDYLLDKFEESHHSYDYEEIFVSKNQLEAFLDEHEFVILSEVDERSEKLPFRVSSSINFFTPEGTNVYNNAERFIERLKSLIKDGYSAVISFNNKRFKEIFTQFLKEHEIAFVEGSKFYDLDKCSVLIIDANFSGGFISENYKLAVFTDYEIFGFQKKAKKTKKKEVFKTNISDLEEGDYVVHVDYGIGIYRGIENKEIGGIKGDYIKVEFENGENLYIPISNIGLLQKYIGTKGATPKLSNLQSNRWKKLKEQAYKSAKKLAVDILKIYAERKSRKGFAFTKSGEILKTVELRFPYEETEDQLVVINEVFNDMESETPMERLVCGDVGFGKTEVAIRAAAKAVENYKQVAILAPTTVLVRQHYQNFIERFKDLPVEIDYISRFKTSREIKKTLERLKKGEIDIIIGTHRLLSKDVEFYDLGLLIVDEEQRFGVNHKEKIKALKSNIDVLTLTATPIPRTLQLSLSGLRDMSIINTPPQDREPVSIKIIKNDEELNNAILKELKRGGQVYFLHNKVEDIEKIAYMLKEKFPLSNIAIAHGQMDAKVLDEVFEKFYQGDVDILVCTTIIENGLDISNANTIIINNAHTFGLAQLYQLKGRVGRGNKRGYCYLRIPQNAKINEVARKRLKIISQLSDLGSGFKISTYDLQIRGAGDLLGAEQSGFVVNVGYELYVQMINDAINELKGDKVDTNVTEINANIPHYIPVSYIPSHRERIEYYRRISELKNFEEIEHIIEDLEILYGDIPEETMNLIYIMCLRNLLSKLGAKSATIFKNSINIVFYEKCDLDVNIFLSKLQNNDKLVANFKNSDTLIIAYKGDSIFLITLLKFFEDYMKVAEKV
ncbi:transcription-repair coupling factor [Deferribacter thermophilus]|uniref:transcription-repair coupling factor n=1 Tax=Deferribacter thermophilus TaxID=53573 RepID=UPI003C25AFD9